MSSVAEKVKWSEVEASIRALERNGRVDPLDLIEAAKHPDHPAHGHFTWNVMQAAEKCWRDEARALIRSCSYQVLVEDTPQRVVSYVASGDEDAVFVSVPKIRRKADIEKMVLVEISAILGLLARTIGLSVSKENTLGSGFTATLREVQGQLIALKERLG